MSGEGGRKVGAGKERKGGRWRKRGERQEV